MRKIKINGPDDVEDFEVADDNAEDILREVVKALKPHGLTVITGDSPNDSVYFKIVKRKEN